MKRLLTAVLTLVMLLTLAVPAFADMLWEPRSNQFYDSHWRQCEYEGRGYYANGKDGFVTAWEAPNGSFVIDQYENGEKLWVYYIYKDWALIARWVAGDEISGWLPMADLALVYDHISFEEEYADRIADYSGEFADYTGTPKVINFYEYPGAPEPSHSAKSGLSDLLANLTGSGEHSSCISNIFVDENDRIWGYVGYLFGIRNVWFCLDEPDGADFPIREVSTPQLTPARAPTLPTQSYIPYILVAAVVIVTGGVLVYFYGRKRKSTD